jgi:outer membrane protein W
MKNIAKFYIFITAFSFILSSNAMAQNQKKQIVKDNIESTSKNEKIADKIINNYDEKSAEIKGKFYLGLDASYQNSTFDGIAKNPYDYYEEQTSAVAVFSGYDNQDFYKIEGFYAKTNEKKQINTNTINFINLSNYELITKTAGIDFKPYLIFDKETRGLFYLIFGVNYNQIDTKEVSQTKTYSIFSGNKTSITSHNSSVNKVSPAFGLGVEYLFYKNFALRFQYKRNFVDAKINNSEVLRKVKIIETLGIGISHAF